MIHQKIDMNHPDKFPVKNLQQAAAQDTSSLQSMWDDWPDRDVRIWVQTLQQLVAAALRNNRVAQISDASQRVLSVQDVLAAQVRLAEQGVHAGDVVMIKANNDMQGVGAMLAAWLQGCTVCPVDPTATPQLHALIAQESKAVAVFESEGQLRRVADAQPQRLRAARATGVDLALTIFTSGSSGNPKGVVLTHSNVMSSLRAITTYLEIDPQQRILCIPPMFLDYGVYQVLFTLFTGCSLVLGAGLKSPLKILDLIQSSQPTILPVVPALASGLAKVLNTFNQTIDSLQMVTNTGGHLAPATIEALRRAFPKARIFPMYGLTETKRALFLPPQFVDDKEGSVGSAMPGLDARVVITRPDGELVEAEIGEIGELYLRGASVMQGYHRDSGGAGARLISGAYRDDMWLATGDLFESDADGCLYFRGRSKSLIKQKGYCIYPRDIEAAAETLPCVASAVVVGRTESDGDESAVLFVVLKPVEDPVAAHEAVREHIQIQLHKNVQPRLIEFLHEWPALPVGKIDLGALQNMAKNL